MLKTYLEDADVSCARHVCLYCPFPYTTDSCRFPLLRWPQAIALTYDMTNRDSFENLQDWLDLVQKQKRPEGKAPAVLALMANKRETAPWCSTRPILETTKLINITPFAASGDLLHLRAVSAEQQENFVKKHGLLQLEVCAKDGVGVSPDNEGLGMPFDNGRVLSSFLFPPPLHRWSWPSGRWWRPSPRSQSATRRPRQCGSGQWLPTL